MNDYNQAIRLNPDDARAYYNRGNSYRKQGDYQSAIADFNEAIRLNPNLVEAYYDRGVSYYEQRDYQNAISNLQQAADLYQEQGNMKYYQNALNKIKELE
jgi:tetratricopeptide (TPR) repeat protein